MPRQRGRKLGLAAAGVAGVMAAGTAPALDAEAADGSRAGTLKQADDDCPQAAAINIPNLLDARKSGNESSAADRPRRKALKKRAAKKKAARKKTTKKTVKRALKKRAAKKATKKRAPRRRNPC